MHSLLRKSNAHQALDLSCSEIEQRIENGLSRIAELVEQNRRNAQIQLLKKGEDKRYWWHKVELLDTQSEDTYCC